ncbi:MAG: YfcE family phosphodiesterase [Desulfobulbus propionicus]|nr:MAG: YfcE family phosphodiesterase [Desulfobulbus propionicus]
MTITAGVISDTHLHRPDRNFKRLIRHCFQDCDVIIHAGDITEPEVLECFTGKTLHAVHGNMCGHALYKQLPEATTFTLGAFTIGLTHGARLGVDIETRLWDIFPEADCMIYGHTHRPACHRVAGTLIVNPGSFKSTGPYGASGTYAILTAGSTLEGTIFEVPAIL